MKKRLKALAPSAPRGLFRRGVEARNLLVVSELIVEAALGREESRGAHYRNDFPVRDEVARHSVMRAGRLTFEGGNGVVLPDGPTARGAVTS